MAKRKNRAIEHYYKKGKYTPMYHDVLGSLAYRSLSPKARCLLLELQRLEFPNRNGMIGLSEKNAAKLLGVSPNTASNAFDELQNRGFVERSFEGDYTIGNASEWRITYLPCKGREATDEWKNWEPEK